jgi:RNA polymerase sigma-70 factor (ECF subfamily)
MGEATFRDAHRTAEAIARHSYGKLVAYLAARNRDVAAAEDALSDAFAAALVEWPRSGCPQKPEAWLLTVARRRLIDGTRRRVAGEQVADDVRDIVAASGCAEESEIPDQRLALMFACTHPSIDVAIRAPLMLQTVLGLDAARIASAFLVSPTTMGKRLVRAKEKIRSAGIPMQIPTRDELPARLADVLDAIYAAYAEGWNDHAATDTPRRQLADEALFLGHILVELAFDEPEALGLLALMLHIEARRRARRSADGEYVPFDEQDPARWDAVMISAAETLLRRAAELGVMGRYQIEAALQSAHVHRRRCGVENWDDVVNLYDALLRFSPSPVVAINRALAIGECDGASAALAAMPDAAQDGRLIEYQPYWAARASLLARTGAHADAHHAYEMAIGLESDPAVRAFLQRRLQRLRM